MLSTLPTYWISIFMLPCWVIKDIDRIRRDFMWSGVDIEHQRCRLVCWKNICRHRDQGGSGILDLHHFNQALLRKWWWKFMTDPKWCGVEVIQFNYGITRWNIFSRQTGRISFSWKGVSSCLAALKGCIHSDINGNSFLERSLV